MTTSTICPTCGGSKSARSAQCQHCHLTAIAPLGYKATEAKFGKKFSVKFVKEYLDKNPSDLEQIVAQWLSDLRAEYETNFRFETSYDGIDSVYLVDFVVRTSQNTTLMIEVDGTWAHQFHAERDARKTAALKEQGFPLLRLDTTTIKSGEALTILQSALAQ